MNSSDKYRQIRDLMTRIERAAFKIALDRKKSSERAVKLRVFSPTKDGLSYRWVAIWDSEIKKIDADEIAKIIQSFISELAEKIWNHKRIVKFPHLNKELLNKHKTTELDLARKFLKSRRYRSVAIKKALQPLRADLKYRIKRISQSKIRQKALQSEVELSGDALVHKQNIVIGEIKHLYKKKELQPDGSHKTVSLFNTDLSLNPRILNEDGTPKLKKLSDRQIASNMVIIFDVTNFWDDKPSDKDIANNEKLIEQWRHKNNFEMIRKRPPFKKNKQN